LLRRLTDRHEAHRPKPWRMQDLPAKYLDGMLKGIIGFAIAVTRLEGKFKLSQNRPATDPPRVITALEMQDDPDATAVAQLMRQRS
ncbi:MAG: FMN-binding negative transcriptional regulator, partial [Streptosporangiaceae bacterium]